MKKILLIYFLLTTVSAFGQNLDCYTYYEDTHAIGCIVIEEDKSNTSETEKVKNSEYHRKYFDFYLENKFDYTVTCNTTTHTVNTLYNIMWNEDGCKSPTGKYSPYEDYTNQEIVLKPSETKYYLGQRSLTYTKRLTEETADYKAVYCNINGFEPSISFNCIDGCSENKILRPDNTCVKGCESNGVQVLAGSSEPITETSFNTDGSCTKSTVTYSCPSSGGSMNFSPPALSSGVSKDGSTCKEGCLNYGKVYYVGDSGYNWSYVYINNNRSFNASCQRIYETSLCESHGNMPTNSRQTYDGWVTTSGTCGEFKGCTRNGTNYNHGRSMGYSALSSCSSAGYQYRYAISCNNGSIKNGTKYIYPCTPPGGGGIE